jgi:hypothetical protein
VSFIAVPIPTFEDFPCGSTKFSVEKDIQGIQWAINAIRNDNMKRLYLILAILGAIVPYVFFFQFIQVNGLNIPTFVSALFVNGAAGGFSADLFFSSFVFWLFMFMQFQKNGPNPLFFIVLNLTIGLSCALPAYLYVREGSDDSGK